MLARLGGAAIYQIGILVPDLEQALEAYSRAFSLGPWVRNRYGPGTGRDFMYRGLPAQYGMELALTGDSPQIELIQADGEGGIYNDWIREHGYGLHHVGFRTPSISQTIEQMVSSGYEVLQAGHGYGLDGDGGFAYFATIKDFGVILEGIESPKRRRPPDAVWPPEKRGIPAPG
jgi:catechol 2,3-dioxygenase-like lactoylglutathione lyase family enzyme